MLGFAVHFYELCYIVMISTSGVMKLTSVDDNDERHDEHDADSNNAADDVTADKYVTSLCCPHSLTH